MKTATSTPYAAPIDSRFITAALKGTNSERNTIIKQKERTGEHRSDDQEQSFVDAIGQVDEHGCLAADVDLVGRHAGTFHGRRDRGRAEMLDEIGGRAVVRAGRRRDEENCDGVGGFVGDGRDLLDTLDLLEGLLNALQVSR